MNMFERAKEDPYDFILGRNFLQDIKLDTRNNRLTFAWDDIEIPMVLRGHWNKTNIGNFWKIKIENTRANVEILDANYTKPNVENVANEQHHHTLQERA